MKSSNVLGYLNVICYASCFWLECNCMKECNVKHKMQQENQHCSWQLSQLKSVQLDLIIVTRSSQVALNIFFKNYKWSKTQLQDSSTKHINEIMFHPFSELFTGCPSKHVSSISCQHSVTVFSLIQPLFIFWPSPCLLSIKTVPLLLLLKNSLHSAHKDQNIWTSLIFPCHFSVWNSLSHELDIFS